MDDPDPLSIIIISIVLVVLLMLSACFSAAETAVLSLNKIRLSHLAKTFKRKGKILENQILENFRFVGKSTGQFGPMALLYIVF